MIKRGPGEKQDIEREICMISALHRSDEMKENELGCACIVHHSYQKCMWGAEETWRKRVACRLQGNLQIDVDVEWIRSLDIGPWKVCEHTDWLSGCIRIRNG